VKYLNMTVAKAALTFAFSEILVSLSLFDNRTGADVKLVMAENIQFLQSTKSMKCLDCLPRAHSSSRHGLPSC